MGEGVERPGEASAEGRAGLAEFAEGDLERSPPFSLVKPLPVFGEQKAFVYCHNASSRPTLDPI